MSQFNESSLFFSPDFKRNEIHLRVEGKSMLINLCLCEVSTMDRPLSDKMDKTLSRIKTKLDKLKKPKSKERRNVKKTLDDSSLDLFAMEMDGKVFDTSALLNSDFTSGMLLRYGLERLIFVLDTPLITSCACFPHHHLMASFPIVASVSTNSTDNIEYVWVIENVDKSMIVVQNGGDIFVPGSNCVGYKLKLYCIPGRTVDGCNYQTGRAVTFYFNHEIHEPVIPRMIEIRKDFVDNIQGRGSIRVGTYNILADPYATSEYSKMVLYSYLDPAYLESEYRSQLIIKELMQLDLDILCLQECDMKVFNNYLNPVLTTKGYTGHYTGKSGSVPEGCAFFVKNTRFTLIYQEELQLKQILRDDPSLHRLFEVRPDMLNILCSKLGTTCQLEVLVDTIDESTVLIIANTHLFYHPSAAYVRLLQTHSIIQAVCRLRNKIQKYGISFLKHKIAESGSLETDSDSVLPIINNPRVIVIVAGDFNSTPETAVIEYLTSGIILPEHEVWQSVDQFQWDRIRGSENESKSSNISTNTVEVNLNILPVLTHDLQLISAAGFPTYTNFTQAFKDLLDYIFIDGSLDVFRVGPFPTYEELIENVAIPSQLYPSDHLAVVVDVQMK